MVFEENGVTFEKVTLTIPKPIVDLHRYIASASGKSEIGYLQLIEEVVAQVTESRFDDGEGLKDSFNLTKSLNRVLDSA